MRGRVRYRRREVRLGCENPCNCRLVINTIHQPSISRDLSITQPALRARAREWRAVAAFLLAGWMVPSAGIATEPTCSSALGAPTLTRILKTRGREPALARFAVIAGHQYLVQLDERDNDALFEVMGAGGQVVARADHPERRTGTRRAVVTADSAVLLVRVVGKEYAGTVGTATIALSDLALLQARPDCLAILRLLGEGDLAYAAAEQIARERSTSPSAHEAFGKAAQAYMAVEHALSLTTDQALRGQAALALAGIEYFDLQDWAQAAVWAQTASTVLAAVDPYRRARADALLAATWIEIGSTAVPPHGAQGGAQGDAANSNDLLPRARQLLQQVTQFHLQRGERYDAGLQLTNTALTYLNEGKFQECVAVSANSSRLFGSINELPRRAQAWQNQALCLWGLGQLPEALRWFERALGDIGPEPYPSIYVAVVTNTALANYALGHLDESLRLYDVALAVSQKMHSSRDEAYSLYGIGVNYYALGDRDRAREFLERSLAIRTVAIDGRGRMASLRALATIDAEQGRVPQALAADQEALGLAIAPATVERIKIQKATHTAAAGRAAEAKQLIDQVVAHGSKDDPLVHAEALLERAALLRSMGRPQEALTDLQAARPALHSFGSAVEEFEADLELARDLREVGQPKASLAAVERALAQSEAVRLQTANPELRAQMRSPLRPAYDLKLELLRDRYEQAVAAGRVREADALAVTAFATADASRAHSFADVASQKYSPDVRRALAAEFARREALYRELSARRYALQTRLERSGADDPRARQLLADIAELRREVDTVNTVIAHRTLSDGTPGQTGRNRPSVPPLGPYTALVSYWLGSAGAYAWVALPGQVRWMRLGSPIAIAGQAIAFHRSLARLVDVAAERRLEDAAALSAMIIRPLEPWLAGVRNWVVIPDGALDYVPFAALRVGEAPQQSFAVMQHDIAMTPAAWMLDSSRSRRPLRASGKILIVADPVYQADDPRLALLKWAPAATSPLERRSYARLRFTAQEASAIAGQFPAADVVELIGVDATRERLLALDWSQFQFIHIATHGVVDAQVPALSALILGSYDANGEVTDGAVRVADLALQSLRAEVAVLSGCETALGTHVRSEGLVGLTSTLLARGARSVVASLWPVPDEIGARQMSEFYQHMLRDSMTPEAALGAVMRSAAVQERSSDPALWGAFQISIAALDSPQPSPRPAAARVGVTP
jgi:CHAT domain-containing protein/tetratricopeptide (TPR) repeat protein